MTWAKLDDQFFYNKKVAQVDGPAKLLYLAGLVYAANQLTDGFIPEKALRFIASTADVANCQDFARQLLDVGLWDATGEGYMIHDYLVWNPSKQQVIATREARAESGRRGGQAKAANAKQTSSNLLSKPLAKPYQKSAPSPSPSQVKEDSAVTPAAAPPEVRAISNAYDASGIMLTPAHQEAHLETIQRCGLTAWQRGWAAAMDVGKHNVPKYVARCAESAMLEAQKPTRTNGNGRGPEIPAADF